MDGNNNCQNIAALRMYIYVLVLFTLIPKALSSMAPTHLLVSRAGPCYEGPELAISMQEFSIMKKIYDSTLTGMLNITEDIPDGWSVKATMQKCQDIRNIDTCDYFKSFYIVKNGCGDGDDEEKDLYYVLFHYTVPRLSCPLRAGSYKLVQYPVFTEDNYLTVYESKISTSAFGYTFRLDGFGVDGQKIFCVDTFLRLVYLRTHNWLPKTYNGTQNTTGETSKENDD